LLRPYIGSCRNRDYISNKLWPSSLFLNDYYFSTIPSSKSFLPYQSKHRIYLSNGETTNALQERVPKEYGSSPIPLDERQLHQEQKAKGFLSSSSSSPFLFQTTENTTPLTYYHSSPSFVKEQQKFHHDHQYQQQFSDWQSLNSENQNNQSLLSEQPKRKQSLIHNHPIEENNSFASSSVLNNINSNQSDLVTSTSILPPFSSHHSITNYNNKSLPKIVKNTLARSPTTITDVYPIDNMSSLRYSSGINPNPPIHSYDQRISDQGNKYIIQLKTDDYQENDFLITPRYYQNQLIIDAKHNEEDSFGGYIRRELHKIFLIPKHIDLNKHTYSYNKNTQELTIEMPYLQSISNENKTDPSIIPPTQNKTQSLTFSYGNLNLTNGGNSLPTVESRSISNTNAIGNDSTIPNNTTGIPSTNDLSIGNSKPFDFDLFHRSAFRPQILQTASNENTHEKKLLMSLDLTDYLPEDIKVTIKDQELIVKAERKIETDTRKSRTSFFQSTSLPPQTDIEHLQSNYIDGKLIIEAPYLDRRNKTTNE
jgi:HSP20 family molecular chaperone IbpA